MGNGRSWSRVAVALLATMLGAALLSACDLTSTCTVHWVGPAAGSFTDPANWDTGSVPTTTQHACADEGTSIVVSTVVDAGRLTSFGTVTVASTGRLNASGAVTVHTLAVRGALAGNGAVAATRFDLRTGTIEGSGPITALGPTTSVDGVTVRGSRALVLNGLTWSGTVRLCDASSLALRGTVRTTLPAGVTSTGCPTPGAPTFTVEPAATLYLGSTLTTDVPLRNQGSLIGSGTIAGAVLNSGTVSPGAPTPIGSFTSYLGRLDLGSYAVEGHGTLVLDLNGDAPEKRDQLTIGADATLASTALIVRQGPNFFPAVGASYDALVVTGGHTLAADLPTPFLATGSNGHWSRRITGGTALTLTMVECLARTSYAGADLRDADLRGCWLDGYDFSVADLTGANFAGARIDGVTFTGATLEGTNLSQYSLGSRALIRSGGIIGTPALSPRTVLAKGYLIGPSTDLSGADLSGARIVGADLTFASLTGVNLTGVVSSGITFTPQFCERTSCIDSSPTFSPGTMIRAGHLVGPGVDLRGVELVGEDLTGAVLTAITIGGADLSGTAGPGNGTGAAMVYDPSSPTRCSDGTLTGSAGVTTCAGRGPGW